MTLTLRKYLLTCEGPQGSLVHEKRVDPQPCAQQGGPLMVLPENLAWQINPVYCEHNSPSLRKNLSGSTALTGSGALVIY